MDPIRIHVSGVVFMLHVSVKFQVLCWILLRQKMYIKCTPFRFYNVYIILREQIDRLAYNTKDKDNPYMFFGVDCNVYKS